MAQKHRPVGEAPKQVKPQVPLDGARASSTFISSLARMSQSAKSHQRRPGEPPASRLNHRARRASKPSPSKICNTVGLNLLTHIKEQERSQRPPYVRGVGPLGTFLRGDCVTALIEDIWCQKIRGCRYRGGNMSA